MCRRNIYYYTANNFWFRGILINFFFEKKTKKKIEIFFLFEFAFINR